MAQRTDELKRRSKYAKELYTPKYKMRVIPKKSKIKLKHKKELFEYE